MSVELLSGMELGNKVGRRNRSKRLKVRFKKSKLAKHFNNVLREVDPYKQNTYLVKIRPPLFFVWCTITNATRRLSGMNNLKIMNNRKWQKREVACLQDLYPHVHSMKTRYHNAFILEKINGKMAYKVLRSKKRTDSEKLEVIDKMVLALKDLHKRGHFHGEPNTLNCIVGEDGEIYWIDFEIEYHNRSEREMRAIDLEQFTLSILGAFRKEGEIGMSDNELITHIFKKYGRKDKVVETLVKKHHLPMFGPFRVLQFNNVSLPRFFAVQRSILTYFKQSRA
jgi:tRNA A-37 threonylcarbamoyl transferase component Bud32